MFETLIVQPIFNVLALIYAVVPGHDFGVAVILFTVVVRLLLWPLLRKQLHQTRLMRELQPEIKKIRARSKGDRQKEATLMMELYKQRGVNPYGSILVLFIQLPILIGLFQGLRRLAENKETLLDLSYGWIQTLGWMRRVADNIDNFDETLLGFVDLTKSGFENGGYYLPVIILAALAGVLQFYQTRQLSPQQKNMRNIRDILKDEAKGKQADQAEINAAIMRNARFFFPALTFVFASSVPGALALYWATGSLVAVVQQRSIFQHDVEEMEEVADTVTADDKPAKKPKAKNSQSGKSRTARKRR